jgi:hypothetical protein
VSRQHRARATITVVALVSIAGFSTLDLVTGLAAPRAAWPQFRGPGSLGVAEPSRTPERWSTTENVAWAADVPGRGWSSPVVWGDRVFVTTAISPGAFKEPSTGLYGHDYIAELAQAGAAAGGGVAPRREMSLATPAVTEDGLFVRTATKLYRIGRPSARGKA